ncbi:hypothetical protein GQ600_3337 [Phytophthora cactorum]|nr:hypothetical protein GQ600_3337 [Phytophthora cactorum]
MRSPRATTSFRSLRPTYTQSQTATLALNTDTREEAERVLARTEAAKTPESGKVYHIEHLQAQFPREDTRGCSNREHFVVTGAQKKPQKLNLRFRALLLRGLVYTSKQYHFPDIGKFDACQCIGGCFFVVCNYVASATSCTPKGCNLDARCGNASLH